MLWADQHERIQKDLQNLANEVYEIHGLAESSIKPGNEKLVRARLKLWLAGSTIREYEKRMEGHANFFGLLLEMMIE